MTAWLDASDPVNAIRTWARVTIVARNTGSRTTGPDRRGRAAAINACKRAVEREPWTDADGRAMRVQLELLCKSYDEAYGFLHESQFTYEIIRTYVREQ